MLCMRLLMMVKMIKPQAQGVELRGCCDHALLAMNTGSGCISL
jgi:hypothetical protein